MMHIVSDPILPNYLEEEMNRFLVSSTADSPLPALSIISQASSNFTLPVDRLLSPDAESGNFTPDLGLMWGGGGEERKSSINIKREPEEEFTPISPRAPTPVEDMGEVDIKEEDMEELEYDISGASPLSSAPSPIDFKPEITNRLGMTEKEARDYVEEKFKAVAIMPDDGLSHEEKIEYILKKSDCTGYTVQDILNFDKTTVECARACANIVQSIPQTYRWWCVEPEDIPKCYTIVCDCKKKSRSKPPRPMNAFMIWAQGCRRLINILCPKMQNALISEALGYYWRLKTEEFRQSFFGEKLRIRKFHAVEYPEYKYKPLTKNQKMLEKQQLNLSKARARAAMNAVKKEKPTKVCSPPAVQTSRSKVKSSPSSGNKVGRPKKSVVATKMAPKTASATRVPANRPTRPSKPEKGITSAATKPAIKDMLTLKILNDRRSRGVSESSPVADPVTHSFGQLSPLEVDSPEMGDIFNTDIDLMSTDYRADQADNSNMPSSVYDTPANTPPVDEEGPRLSPNLTPLQVSISSPVPLLPSEPVKVSSVPSTSSTTQALMPSLSAILSSPSMAVSASSNTVPICVLGGLKAARIARIQPSPQSRPSAKVTTSYVLTSVAEALVPFIQSGSVTTATTSSNSTGCKNFRLVPLLNGVKVEAVNGARSNIKQAPITVLSQPPSYQAAVSAKGIGALPTPISVPAVDDLDSLSIDTSVPLLSDDEMRSLLNSLN